MARGGGGSVLVLLILLGLALVGFSLLNKGDNDGGVTETTTTTANNCNGYGFTKTVKIIDNSLGVDAYIALYWHSNGTLAGFEVRYDYTLPRPMSQPTGWLKATIDGNTIYDDVATYMIDIPSKYEDGREHTITVIYETCR